MSEYEREFIKRVRREIATLGLTMDAVGKAIGSSRQVLSQILNGKFQSMRADTMLKLSAYLKISLDEITGVRAFPVDDAVDALHYATKPSEQEVARQKLIAKHYNDIRKRLLYQEVTTR